MFFIDLDKKSNERYSLGKLTEFSSNTYDILNSYFMGKINQLPVGGYYTIKGEIGRPDMLSYNIYGDVQYWWILMYFNALLDVSELVGGLTLKYPSLNDIEDLYFSLRAAERANT